MKRLLFALIPVLLLALAGGAFYYSRLPAFGEAVLCKFVDADGNPGEKLESAVSDKGKITYYVLPNDTTVYVSVKVTNLFTKKAMMRWYKGEPDESTRIKVDDNVAVSKAGYVSSKLTIPDGFAEGKYTVLIYKADGKEISENRLVFEVKK